MIVKGEKQVAFCTECYFFGYTVIREYEDVYSGFGDHADTTDSCPTRVCCPDCGGDVIVVEVSEEGIKLIRRAAEVLSRADDELLDLEQTFELYEDASFSRVLTYYALKHGKRVFRPIVSLGRNEQELIDHLVLAVLLRKMAVKRPRAVKLGDALVKHDFDVKKAISEIDGEDVVRIAASCNSYNGREG